MTVRKIAERANVSPATVSLVLNNKDSVSQETKNRVMRIAQEIGYQAKNKGSKIGKKKSIRFVKYKEEGMLAERNGDFITRVIDGVENEARKRSMDLKITNITSSNIMEMISKINAENADDGIVFLGTEFQADNAETLKLFKAPLVVIDNEMKFVNIDSVVMDNSTIVYTAVKKLYDLGHRKIGHIKSLKKTESLKERHLAFKLVMNKLSLDIEEKYTYCAMPEIQYAQEPIHNQLKSPEKELPTAFFADNDTMALAAIRALKDIGVRVPDDVSIIGVDDLLISSYSEPKLTTIRIHTKTMGKKAVERLVDLINSDNTGVIKTFVGSELVERESTLEYRG
ncbi:LacI family DNA-binding transcriptional regulator [Natronincola ferrireducens]|uniref:LacI family transcriptional regulator n=1 Tax=Natronincola ferrireducens TaxID=393762 RepID=A0A1G9GIB1_9FIRM|nr:LacI family DNA-binding transcriptional regulator [Natronincola ferrireducens]SDL00414.1 LacI family transcriptional regulator [Natronincola ferrireducens]